MVQKKESRSPMSVIGTTGGVKGTVGTFASKVKFATRAGGGNDYSKAFLAAEIATASRQMLQLFSVIEEHYRVSRAMIMSGERVKNTIEARKMFCVLAYYAVRPKSPSVCTFSFIGGHVGILHASVIHHIKKHKDYLDTEQEYGKIYRMLYSKFTNKINPDTPEAMIANLSDMIRQKIALEKDIETLTDYLLYQMQVNQELIDQAHEDAKD